MRPGYTVETMTKTAILGVLLVKSDRIDDTRFSGNWDEHLRKIIEDVRKVHEVTSTIRTNDGPDRIVDKIQKALITEEPRTAYTSKKTMENRKSALKNIGVNIDEEADKPNNTHCLRMGSFLSMAGLHETPGCRAYASLLINGCPRIWTFVERSQRPKLLVKSFDDTLRAVDIGQTSRGCPKCGHSLICKSRVMFTSKLDDNGVKYSTFLQKQGDLVYVNEGTYFSVIDTGLNFAEEKALVEA